MNVTEMHIAVQQGVDKIHSLQADSLLSEEIDIELNKAMFRFVNLKYGKNNLYRKGFEESQKRIDDLRTLVREFETIVTFKEQLSEDIWVDTFTLPNDYMYLVNQHSKLWIDNCHPMGYVLENPPEISYFVLDLNDFICNNAAGNSTSFVFKIGMMEDIDDLVGNNALLWSPSQDLQDAGYTPSSYPSFIEEVKQDIINFPQAGFDVYWEEFQTLIFPGKLIVVVDTDVHDWFNANASVGTPTNMVGFDESNNQLVHQQGLLTDTAFSEKRVPQSFSRRITSLNKFSQQDDIFKLLDDPFNTTKYTSPLTTIRGRMIDIYTSDIFIIDTVKITYIRRPQNISLSLGIDCELPEHSHEEIIAMTVSSILEGIKDPRYSTIQGELARHE